MENTKNYKKIANYIKKQGYTWTVEDAIELYKKKENGEYISYTANDIVGRFPEEIKSLIQ
jgi:hypothetical protein